MQKSLEDMESWKEEVHLPEGAENLMIFSKARMLLEQLDGLEQITREKTCLLEVQHVLKRGLCQNAVIEILYKYKS